MLSRLMRGLAVGAVAALMTVSSAFAQAVIMDPGAGTESQVFVLAGAGFTPGARLDVTLVSPAGEVFTPVLPNGNPAVVVVADDGSFAYDFVPARDLAGAQAGAWMGRVCVEGTEECWMGEFVINLDAPPVEFPAEPPAEEMPAEEPAM